MMTLDELIVAVQSGDPLADSQDSIKRLEKGVFIRGECTCTHYAAHLKIILDDSSFRLYYKCPEEEEPEEIDLEKGWQFCGVYRDYKDLVSFAYYYV